MPPFERSEFDGRIAETKRRMAAAGIEVLLVTSPANIYYLTGYDACSFYTHQMVILAGEAAEPIWAGRAMDVSSARLTVFMGEDSIRGYDDRFVGSPERHPMQFMAEALREEGWDRRAVGVEMDEYYFTARCYEVLRRALPDADFRDAGLLVNWVRLVKSPQELAYMREAGEIATRTIQAALDAIEPGVRQSIPMSALYAAQIAGTDAFGGDYSCKPPINGTGARSEAVHLTWEDKVHRAGETTWIETGGCRYHYHAPISRTIHLGTPPQAMWDRAKAAADGLSAVLDAARPGAVCADLEAAWRGVVSPRGIEPAARIGYPVGIGFAPTWGELTASLRPGDRTVLAPGMTFHCIPGIWRKDGTIVISESFEVTEAGGKAFADVPRELFTKP